MPLVSITRLHLRSLRFLPPFALYSFRSAQAAAAAPGFLGGWLGDEGVYGYWTATVWETADAMRAFRNAAPHLHAMPRFLHWTDGGAYTHWESPLAAVPDARQVWERLRDTGQLSKVRRPSPAHAAGETVGAALPTIRRRLVAAR